MNRSAFGLKLSQRRLGPPSTIQSLPSLPRRMPARIWNTSEGAVLARFRRKRGHPDSLLRSIRSGPSCPPPVGSTHASQQGRNPVIKGQGLAKANGTGSREKIDGHESLNHSTAQAGSGESEWNIARGAGRRLEKREYELICSTPSPLAERQERLGRVTQG